ncbi:hypothetical protein DUNSADRAFT_18633 [Dunaliella salina]|uniref:Uncharacterized protein n=1 Tax=Dunaliella salina TaxID=3046 RepID=A0ABQ7FZQ9_DUNSA|nr:hypothetical protein DUNSADRAFT_18633 [Dunaliella salina]|eukprot:KAF5827843.1 hypothetical protein DUNSADRAFT_18633 [Dunaliella salina]
MPRIRSRLKSYKQLKALVKVPLPRWSCAITALRSSVPLAPRIPNLPAGLWL